MKVTANLSRFHPDHGMSPAEHAERKAKRAAGKAKFVSKEKNRAAYYGLVKKRLMR